MPSLATRYRVVCFLLASAISSVALGQKIAKDSIRIDSSRRLTNTFTPTPVSYVPQVTPKSPNVAAFERYGNYAVSLHNGLPTIEIPLYEFSVGGVRVPIKLAFHAAGHKVTDQATWVGMGWTLHTGGAVTRTVQGLADEQRGTQTREIESPYTVHNVACHNAAIDYDINRIVAGLEDVQRDQFNYQHPTGGNSFIITPNGCQPLQPDQVLIEALSATNSITGFRITDERGNRYTFSEAETILYGSNGYNSAWHLTEISGHTTTERAEYDYASFTPTMAAPDMVETVFVNEMQYSYRSEGEGFPVELGVARPLPAYNAAAQVTTSLPTQIRFPGGRLDFIQSTTQFTNGVPMLERLDIMGLNTSGQYERIKAFGLRYEAKDRYESPVTFDYFLVGVDLLDKALTTIGQYGLTYNSEPLPAATSYARDYWGYSNGQPNLGLIPEREVQIQSSPSAPPGFITVGNANRTPNEATMKARAISRITYPTGGHSEFEFEANRYLDAAGMAQLAGGLRVKAIRSYTAEGQAVFEKTYRYGVGESGEGTLRSDAATRTYAAKQLINYFDPFPSQGDDFSYTYRQTLFSSAPTAPLTPHEGSPVTYPEVAEYEQANGQQGKTVYHFKDDVDDFVLPAPETSRNVVVSRHWARGQLRQKDVYAAGGALRQRTQHTYTTLGGGVTSGFMGLQVHKYIEEVGATLESTTPPNCYISTNGLGGTPPHFIVPYYYSYGTLKLTRTETRQYETADQNSYTFQTTETDYDPTLLMPREVRQSIEAEAITGQRFSYPQDFGPNIPSTATTELQGIRALQQQNRHQPYETVRFRMSNPTATPSYKAGTLTTYQPVATNAGTMGLPYQTYLIETEFGSGSWQSAAERYVAAGGNGNDFLKDPLYGPARLTMTDYDLLGNLIRYEIPGGAATRLTYLSTSLYQPTTPLSVVSEQVQNDGATNAQTTQYGYTIPLLGISSQTDPRGVNTTYHYDSFGRLQAIKDHYDRIIKQYTYRYATQP
jgi:YD repeat-containing protein